VVHIGDGQEAIIVEGEVVIDRPTQEMAARLSDASFAKYPQHGRLDPSIYLGGVSVLRPRRVLAWTSFTENATRFRFEERSTDSSVRTAPQEFLHRRRSG
jgi:hypothetical protein